MSKKEKEYRWSAAVKQVPSDGGRPLFDIDEETFKRLCEIQCTEEEIAIVLGICVDTINSWCKRKYDKTFSEISAHMRAGGKASLRHYQFQQAKKSHQMAIFLGKQYLGQSDNPHATESEKGAVNITIEMADYSNKNNGQS